MAVIGPTKLLIKLFSTLAPSGDYSGGPTGQFIVDEAWPSGTGARQGDKPFNDVRTIAPSSNEDLDLEALLDAAGVALALVDVVAIAFKAAEGNNDDLEITPAVGTAWVSLFKAGSNLVLRPGAFMVFGCTADPAWAVAGGNKTFNVANIDAGVSATYQVWLIGRSA